MNSENQMMVICSASTRPMRSDTAPMIQPPSAEATRVTLPIRPASALLRLKAAINAGIARLNICTSSASSAQPPKQPQKVLRSPCDTCLYQCNMVLPFMVLLVVDARATAMQRAAWNQRMSAW